MYCFIKKVSFLVGLTLCIIISVHSQVVTSTRDGLWTDASLWTGGQVPTLANATETVIDHNVIIPGSNAIAIQNTRINGSLTVASGTTVDLISDAFTDQWDLQVAGILILEDGALLEGTSVANTSFEAGSRYIHLQGPLGFIPYATWNKQSTFEIAGFRAQGYINIAHSDSWKQIFGNVVYNCLEQTTAFVDLNGYLRNISGNFIVQNTNNHALRLSTTQSPVISIGEDFIIEGISKVWFSTNSANAIINIRKDFRYRSSSSGISYLATKGSVIVNVEGEMEVNSPGRIHLASTSADSVGLRQATINLSRHLYINSGLIVAPPSPGKGTIVFQGFETQTVVSSPTGSTFQGNLDFVIEETATVALGNSVLSNQSGTLLVKGKLQVGSSDPGGAIQLGNSGNLHIQQARIFQIGSTVEYNGIDGQFIGNGHPSTLGVNLVCSNLAGVTLLNGVDVEDFTIAEGGFNTQTFALTIRGNISIADGVELNAEQINLSGGRNQQIAAAGFLFRNLTINKSPNSSVTLLNSLRISTTLWIQSSGTSFNSNGNLELVSTSDVGPATASVGPLISGSSIVGDVTVQRYMSGEGRIYRYISSPVQNSTVASLMDDFPITGTFQDPTIGPGINSSSPSFYYYDESRGGLQAGWLPYPINGLASSNPLIVGKGYAAFIRNGSSSTIWDVTGSLNQGTIELPVAFTSNTEESNGWNLVGNPYASAIQWDEEGMDKWSMENISSVIAIRDNGGGGTFKYWDMDENYSELPGGQIATGQSFWARATGPNPKLTIREGVKVFGDATFFRKQPRHIPSFAISLSRDSLTDVAYFKIRPTAKPELDKWDGLKLDNDNFDLSFISTDHKSLAIHARDKMPCDEVIKIGLKDVTPGVYVLNLTTKYEFSRYQFTLVDKFFNTQTRLTPNQTLKITITDNKASQAFDRFSVRVKEMLPKADIEIIAPTVACSGQVVTFILKDAESDVNYTIWNDETKLLASDTATANGDLVMSFFADSLRQGNHTIRIKAHGSCEVVSLSSTLSIVKVESPNVLATSSKACAGNSITLTASSDREGVVFNWFSEKNSGDTLAFSSIYITPSLSKPKQYYVSASLPSGCSSERFPIDADILAYDSAKITLMDEVMLSSNYTSNNSWYFNGQKIEGATGQYMKMVLPGIYTLQIDTLGCVSLDSFEYIILSREETNAISGFYPNPINDFLFFHDPYHRIERLEVFDSSGKLKFEINFETLKKDVVQCLDVHHLSPGVYVAILVEPSRKRVIRFIKI